jgi:diamine N-acetyltransferase
MLDIRPVTKDNWRELGRLKVQESQTHFVASNIFSIAEAQFGGDYTETGHWDMFPHGIYEGEMPVGFLMYALNFECPEMQALIVRLMVDEKYQGRGYGFFAMKWILANLHFDNRVSKVGISYEPDNVVARSLYSKCGFVETGEMLGEEVLAVLKVH